MEKINGISFEDWACASANLAHGMPVGEVLDILGVSIEDWQDTNKQWGEKMATIAMENPEVTMKYAEIFSNPKVGKFADVEFIGETPKHLLQTNDEDRDFDTNKSVKDLMQEANSLQNEPQKAVEALKKAIILMDDDDDDDDDNEYDNLYAHYFIMKHYQQQPEETKQAVDYAEKCLDLMMPMIRAGNIWRYTDEGEFQMEVIRVSTNTVAWNMMQNTDDTDKLDKALDIIDIGIGYIDEALPSEYYLYLYDTKVRILLKMKDTHTAYCCIYQTLEEDPNFSDFEDIKNSSEYKEWLKSDKFKKFLEELDEEDEDDSY